MIYYKHGKWNICEEKVRYMQYGKEIVQYVGSEGHDWWVDFEQKWEHTEIMDFIPVESTPEQVARLEKVNRLRIPDGFGGELGDYVERGIFPEGFAHVLRPIQIQEEQLQQDEYLVDLDFRQSLSELGV